MKTYIRDFKSFSLINESIESDQSFVDYIVSVEGIGPGSSPATGHKAYKDIAGVWTIGYGHAETSDVSPKPVPGMKISDAKAKEILKKDIADAERKVRNYISSKFPDKTLDQNQLKMLTDYAFNPGLSKFPNFVKAVVNKDWQTAAKQYKRYSGVKELTDRNTKFYNKFLAPLLSGSTSSKKTPTPAEKAKLEPMEETSTKRDYTAAPVGKVVGKQVWPISTNEHDFANVREEAEIDNGWFDNIIKVVKWPTRIGKAIGVTPNRDKDNKLWYKIDLGNGQVGWCREDVITIIDPNS
jgi:GH24 family phage-related lysozyme (muramidase)